MRTTLMNPALVVLSLPGFRIVLLATAKVGAGAGCLRHFFVNRQLMDGLGSRRGRLPPGLITGGKRLRR